MRGRQSHQGGMFSYVSLEKRVPAKHPFRAIRAVVDEVLAGMDTALAGLYASTGRPSIPPEQILKALLLQAFYSIRSERQLAQSGENEQAVRSKLNSAYGGNRTGRTAA